ncbi:MAG: hypothetical protein NDJ89_02105 [Oligoflexia bacterium]|nr:hypothetical protein [Oligoflexia bacterium]
MMKRFGILNSAFLLAAALATALPSTGLARPNLVEATKTSAEGTLRTLVEPLLNKYCQDQCKLLSVTVNVDVAVPEEVAPGFDDVHAQSDLTLAPSSARLKLLMDEKIGPNLRRNILEYLQRNLDTLDYPVRIDTQLARFPQPVGSEVKVAELRARISKQFQARIDEIISKHCPNHCVFSDFDLETEVANGEESQYWTPGEYEQDGGVALKIKDISGTLLIDETLSPEERDGIFEVAKMRTNSFKHVNLTAKAIRFPRPPAVENGVLVSGAQAYGALDRRLAGASSESKTSTTADNKKIDTSTSTSQSTNNATTSTSSNTESKNSAQSNNQTTSNEQSSRQERFERFEKIERVENGDAVQAELQKFKLYGLIFACSVLSLLIFIALATLRPRGKDGGGSTIHRVIQSLASDPISQAGTAASPAESGGDNRGSTVAKRYEIERLVEELSGIFAQHPKVAKYVFSRVLTEDGVEITANYIHIFGESIVVDMLRDASLQSDLGELMEYYAKTPIELSDEDKLDLLRRLHNRTVAGKLAVMGNRSSNLFDFLAEMDSTQILEMIRTESLTIKAIVLTQCDAQKRASIYTHLDEDVRMKLLTELSRIDYLPRDYIFNVSNALKRKRRENPKLNTEALPGSEVLVTLLERTGTAMQKSVVKNLEISNPESARTIKGKLVSIDTLRYLRDAQLLEVVLSLRHDELLQFLKGATQEIRGAIFAKSPKDLVAELEEALGTAPTPSREAYQAVERKVLNRMKIMANEGLINLIEVNERMFAEATGETAYIATGPQNGATSTNIKKVAGW